VVAYTRAKRVSDRECLFDIALNHAQRLIRKSLQPHHPRQGYTRGHPLFELKADDVRAVTGADIAAEHTLDMLPRTRLIAQKALGILIVLIEHPGDLVTKEELVARVWPDTTVEEGNLRVHMAALRKALGDGQDGNRYVTTIPGRGYRFVAPISLSETTLDEPPIAPASAHNLPALLRAARCRHRHSRS